MGARSVEVSVQSSTERVPLAPRAWPATAPTRLDVCLPVVPGVGTVAGAFTAAVLAAWDLPPDVGAVDDAVPAVADALIRGAMAWSALDLSLERDDVDLYVRLTARAEPDDEQALVAAIDAAVPREVDSHHVAMEDTRLLVVLQIDVR